MVVVPLVKISPGGANDGAHGAIVTGTTYTIGISMGNVRVETSGTVMGCSTDGIRFSFAATPLLERQLSPHIFQRQAQLIRELKDMAMEKGFM